MALVETKDDVIWAKSVRDDEALRKLILELPPGATINLNFPEFGKGSFVKMKSDATGRRTNGIRPAPPTRTLWRQIKAERRGMPVRVCLSDGVETPIDSVGAFCLTPQQRQWASKPKQGVSPAELEGLLAQQSGRCALSGVEMIFNLEERTPSKDGAGCHPLSPAVDHIDPGNRHGGHQIVCYALNDLKGHLPTDCFDALCTTDAWKSLMARWRAQADADPTDRDVFRRLLRPNAAAKKRKIGGEL
jgi:hypothetical protein